jgi:hypothetical protein
MTSLDKIENVTINKTNKSFYDGTELYAIFKRFIGYSDKISFKLNDIKRILNN